MKNEEQKRKWKHVSNPVPQKAPRPAYPVSPCPSDLVYNVLKDTHPADDILDQMGGKNVPVPFFPEAIADLVILG
jgi:hypothetical protein